MNAKISKHITRVGGHARLTIILGENEARAHFNLAEFRSFEMFLKGRKAEEAQWISSRICGICHMAHVLASVKAVEDMWDVEVPETGIALRKIAQQAEIIDSHVLQLIFLVGPDILYGGGRSSFIDLAKVNPLIIKKAINIRSKAEEIIRIIAGREVHPVGIIPGGISKPLSKEEAEAVAERAEALYKDVMWFSEEFLSAVIEDDVLREIGVKTSYAALTGEEGSLEYYDGKVRVINGDGSIIGEFSNSDYTNYVVEKTVPYNYAKNPFIKLGDKLVPYKVGPLARQNATSPSGDKARELKSTLWKDLHHTTRCYNIARIIEIVDLAESILNIVRNQNISSTNVKSSDVKIKEGEGVGIVEAPRGLLVHHYKCDERGLLTFVNIITPTAMFTPALEADLTEYLTRNLREKGEIDKVLIKNAISAIRDYDPCIPCATHNIVVEVRRVLENL